MVFLQLLEADAVVLRGVGNAAFFLIEQAQQLAFDEEAGVHHLRNVGGAHVVQPFVGHDGLNAGCYVVENHKAMGE